MRRPLRVGFRNLVPCIGTYTGLLVYYLRRHSIVRNKYVLGNTKHLGFFYNFDQPSDYRTTLGSPSY